jgi:L,D-transpeptidase ErfK/SrfK
MDLEGTDYGIHGTDSPWSIGRLVTHGCIRMYPEDIAALLREVNRRS